MPTITLSEARARSTEFRKTSFGIPKSATAVLDETLRAQAADHEYDIFLSHAYLDAEVILGVKAILEDYGHSVYIDWVEDQQLDRSKVTPETADALRTRMTRCKSLFYATTENSSTSKWMPWECGYFDAKKSRCAILPVTTSPTNSYKGQEYLALYPYITEDTAYSETIAELNNRKMLWVHRTPDVYVMYRAWLLGVEPMKH